MDVLILFGAVVGLFFGWRLCAELRRIREALETIAFRVGKSY